MSMFGDINPDEISTGPKDGVYNATVRSVEVNHRAKSGNNFILVQYDMQDPSFEFPVRQYLPWPENMNPAAWDDTTPYDDKGNTEKSLNQRALTRWKRTLIEGYGVPADRVGQVTPDMLEGLPVTVTIRMNNDFPGVQRVVPQGQTSGVAPVTPSAPSTPATTAPSPATSQTAAPASSAPAANPFA